MKLLKIDFLQNISLKVGMNSRKRNFSKNREIKLK